MSYEQYRYAVKHPESGGDHGRIRPHKNIILQQQSQQQTSYYQPHVSTAQHLDHAWTDTQVHHNGNKNGQYRKKMPETSMDYGRSGSQSYGQQKIFAQFQNQGSHSKNVRSRELHDMDEQDFSDLDEQDQEEEEEQTWRVHGKKHPEPPSGYGRPNKQSHFHTNGSQDRLQSAMADVHEEVTENYQSGYPNYPAKSKESSGDFRGHFRY